LGGSGLSSEWKTYSLEEISEDISYGYTASAQDKKVGPKFLRITDIRDYFVDWSSVPYCEIDEQNKLKYKLELGDLCVARTGATTGINTVIKKEVDAVFASYLIRFRLNKKLVNPFFIGYIFSSKLWSDYVNSIIGGSAQPGANAKQMSKFTMSIPPLSEQDAITRLLSSLDDKIELNNAINKNLEEMAQALFKQWFVDFEFPNENGEPYKSSGGEFEESELGLIPKGWKVGKLGEVLEFKYGKALKESERIHGDVPVYGSNGCVGYHNEPLVKGPGIVVGRKGNPGVVKFVNSDFYPIDTTFYVVNKTNFQDSWNYFYYMLVWQDLKKLSSDSAVPGLNKNIVYMNSILIPIKELVEAFESQLQNLRNLISEKEKENHFLSKIRDTLLPKLMSGEIRVPVEQP
jgi:type I restriction enzyme S subunit